ncbi:AAA family ATPase [Nocardioides sp.]|uniref:AAA family ATPase n=1 Tax=Nocardioides sp. TaxID=35761 RepID=UPI003565D93A
MPAAVDPDTATLTSLLTALPSSAHGVESVDRLMVWLPDHTGEYVVVLGPNLPIEEAVTLCERLRVSRPTISVVLVRHTLETHDLTAAMKAGARDVVTYDDHTALTGAVRRAHELYVALRGPTGALHTGKIVTVFSPKGGVGKTTMAVNLALALTDRGARRVCLVDLDLAFGDVAITLQLFPTHSIEQAVGSEDTLDEQMLTGLLTRHHDSLMVLAAPSHPDVHERITSALVQRVLRTLQESFDYVVVDTAPAFDEQTLAALDETDECVIVATLDVPTLKNVKVALETLEMLNVAQGHRHLLLNRADDAVGIGPDKVETILGMKVVTQIATAMDIAASTNAGNPIVSGSPGHPSSVALRRLATLLAGEPAAPDQPVLDASPGSEKPDKAERSSRRFKIRR